MKAITIEVAIDEFVKLSLLAEVRGHDTVTGMLSEIVDNLTRLDTAPQRNITADRVVRFTLEGFTDREIARSLNVTNELVKRHRLAAGLTANRASSSITQQRKASA